MSELKRKILEGIRTSGLQEWAFTINAYDEVMEYEKLADEDIDELATAILNEISSQPSLNENQQVVLEWLKNKYTITDIEPIELFWRLHVNTKNRFKTLLAYRAYKSLTRKAQLEVLQAFSQWALEKEEEKCLDV